MGKSNANLNRAREEKNDEFYTRYEDIAKEMVYYTEHFKDKVIYCNCDDPFKSNFVRYFIVNFHAFGLKRVIATCFKDEEKKRFNFGHRKYAKGTFLDYHGELGDVVRDFPIDLISPYTRLLEGNGDFRNKECQELLDESDIVVTNPPFSLFKEFLLLLEEHGKKYIVLGNGNAVAYKEVFPLIKENKVWLGIKRIGGRFDFIVPKSHDGKYVRERDGVRIAEVSNACWFTNLDHKHRPEFLSLNKKYYPSIYPKYDNYDAIEVSKVADIPMDYDGLIGVPITILDRYNPEQFEIVGLLGDGLVGGKELYKRILIRKRSN